LRNQPLGELRLQAAIITAGYIGQFVDQVSGWLLLQVQPGAGAS
jgi:hypothetical protein